MSKRMPGYISSVLGVLFLFLVGCEATLPKEPEIIRLEISPGGLLLTEAGASQPLTARAVDRAGNPVAITIKWTSSAPDEVSVDASGTVTANVNAGSAQIVAEAQGVQSPPVFVLVAQPEPNALLVSDAQIVSDPQPLEGNEPLRVGSQFKVTLADVNTLTPGTVVLSREAKALAGKVVSSSPTANGQEVVLELVPLPQLFRTLSLEETFDLSQVDPVITTAGLSSQKLSDGSWQLRFDPASNLTAQAEFKIGKDCKTDGGFTQGLSSSLAFNLKQTLDFDFILELNETDEIENLRMKGTGSVGIEMSGSMKFSSAIKGELSCALNLVNLPVPVTGPLAAVLSPTVPIGLKFGLKGDVSVTLFEVGLEGKLQPTLTLGFDYTPATGFVNLADFESGAALSPKLTVPGEKLARLQAETSFQATAGIGIGNALFTFEVVQVALGPKLSANLAAPSDQIADTTFSGNYDAKFVGEFGPGQDVQDVIEIIFGKPDSINLTLSTELALAQSPTGTVSADKNTVKAGDKITFQVKLDPANVNFLPGFYNVKEIRIYRKETLAGLPDAQLVATQQGSEGLTDYSLEVTASQDDTIQGNYFAFVVTKLMPFAPLELGSVTAEEGTRFEGEITVLWREESKWDETYKARETSSLRTSGGFLRGTYSQELQSVLQVEVEQIGDDLIFTIFDQTSHGLVSHEQDYQASYTWIHNDCTTTDTYTIDETLTGNSSELGFASYNGEVLELLAVVPVSGNLTVVFDGLVNSSEACERRSGTETEEHSKDVGGWRAFPIVLDPDAPETFTGSYSDTTVTPTNNETEAEITKSTVTETLELTWNLQPK